MKKESRDSIFMSVSAIVVTFNRIKLLKECIDDLLTQRYELDYIFVVNNNSTDGTKEYLDNVDSNKVIPIHSTKNLGGAGGFSLGTDIAYNKSNSDYLWLMDDDTMTTYDALDKLIKSANKLNNNFGFLCSNVRWWKDYHPMNLPKVSQYDWSQFLPDNVIKVKCATFVSIFIKRDVITQLGLPISDMFIWGDDYEYSTRIAKYFNSYFVSNSIVIHKCANSNGNETIYNSKRIKNFNYLYRNNIFIAKKYYGFKKIMKEILNDLSVFFETLFISKNKKIRRSFCVLSGIIKGIFFNPIVYYPNKKNNYHE